MTRHDADAAAVDAVQSAFDELGRISFAEHSLESVLHRVTELAARVLPGEPVTSVTILHDGKPATVAASGRLAQDLDEEQYRLGAGPCLSAASTGASPSSSTPRPPPSGQSSPHCAAARGCGSVLSYPLPVQELSPAR